MKVLIVSGFLGAGKTTFIQKLSEASQKKFVILENEYSASGIDAARLSGAQNDNIWEMTERCICCTGQKDFATSVLTIANAVDPEFLVVEPTGIGRLSRIIENLKQIEYERIVLLAPITVVDILSFDRYLGEYPELYRDQISFADTIILSKTEASDSDEKNRVVSAIKQLNPNAKIITDYQASMSFSDYTACLEKTWDKREIPLEKNEPDILPDVFSIENISIDSPERFLVFLEDIIHGCYGNIVRSKGLLKAGDCSLQFDVADSRYSVIGYDGDAPAKLVFIGENIDREKIREQFDSNIRAKRIFFHSGAKVKNHQIN